MSLQPKMLLNLDIVASGIFTILMFLGPSALRWHNVDGRMINSPIFWPVMVALAVSEFWLLHRLDK
jgi:hypothetical protein